MTMFPSKGETFAIAVETALGTAGSYSDIRYEQDSLTLPFNTRIGLANANAGHRHAYDISDKPIFLEQFRDGAISFSLACRRHGTANTAPIIANILESAGWSINSTTATTVASYSSTTAWDLGDSGAAYGTPGEFILVKLEDGSSTLDEFYYPVLIAAKATDTVTPAMALPAATANSEPIEVMTTMWPQTRIVPATKTLSCKFNLRATHTTGEDLQFVYSGCGCKSVGDIVLEPGKPIIFPFTLSCCRIVDSSSAIDDESFVDTEKYAVITHDCRVELAVYNDSGGITRTDTILRKATINLGFEGVGQPGFGSGTLAGIQGYALRRGTPRITITADYSKDFWDDIEGTNASQYICIAQPTSALTTPAFAVCMPKCHIDWENALELDRSGDTITCTVPYIGSVADYNSETDNDDAGAAPIFIGIAGSST